MIYSGSSSEFSEIRIQAKVPDPGGSGSITLEFLNSVELFGSESAFGMRIQIYKVAEYISNLNPNPQHCVSVLPVNFC